MTHGRLHRANDECVIPGVSRTSNFLERMRGLLAKPALNENQGLLIFPCSSVHTFGMSYAIDLVFLDNSWTIVKTVDSLKPWRMTASRAANMVLELAAGSLGRLQLSTGQQLEWHDDED